MARPKKCRSIACQPNASYFKPRGIPLRQLEEVSLSPDELEAINLADYQDLYHQDAADMMGISRSTFGRILQEARRKVADALIHGKALHIETQGTHNEDSWDA